MYVCLLSHYRLLNCITKIKWCSHCTAHDIVRHRTTQRHRTMSHDVVRCRATSCGMWTINVFNYSDTGRHRPMSCAVWTPFNTRLLCASVSCWARLFLQHLRCRSLWIIWLWGLSSWLSNSDSTVSKFSSVCALRLPLPGRLSTVPNFTSSMLMLFFVQPLFRNSVINCRAL